MAPSIFSIKKLFGMGNKEIKKDIEVKESRDEEMEGNILVEKTFLNFYHKIFKAQLMLYLIAGNVVLYFATSMVFKHFNRPFILTLLGTALSVNGYCIYAKTIKYREFEGNIQPMYEKQLKKYH
jgi:uncharacterized membrane protein YoaT (DUF817 family)